MVNTQPTLYDSSSADISQCSTVWNDHSKRPGLWQVRRLKSPTKWPIRSMEGTRIHSLAEMANAASGIAKHADIVRKALLQI